MSDFGDRIRDARTSTRPLVGLAAVPAAEPVPAEEAEAVAEEPPSEPVAQTAEAGPAAAATTDELEEHRHRVEELARKVDALNAALLRELTHHPGGPAEFPRTMAVLADELVDRVSDSE
jgi:hypothetical protein